MKLFDEEERKLQQELYQQILDMLPREKPKATVDFELEIAGWTVEQISEVSKKIREEHKGECDLHIKFVGRLNPIPSANYSKECKSGIENAVKCSLGKLSSVGVLEDSAENSEKCAAEIGGKAVAKTALELL